MQKKMQHPRRKWIHLGIVLVLAVVLLLVALVFQRKPTERKLYRNPENIASKYMNAMLDPQWKNVPSLMPPEVQAVYFPNADTTTQWSSDLDNKTNALYQSLREEYDYWDIRYQLGSTSALSQEQLSQLQDYYATAYDCHVENGLTISADLHITLNDDKNIVSLHIYLIQVDGCWYLDLDHSETILDRK